MLACTGSFWHHKKPPKKQTKKPQKQPKPTNKQNKKTQQENPTKPNKKKKGKREELPTDELMSCSTKKSGSLSAKIALHYILDLQPVFNTNFAKLFLFAFKDARSSLKLT